MKVSSSKMQPDWEDETQFSLAFISFCITIFQNGLNEIIFMIYILSKNMKYVRIKGGYSCITFLIKQTQIAQNSIIFFLFIVQAEFQKPFCVLLKV